MKVVPDEGGSAPNPNDPESTLSEERFNNIFFKSCGAPRYIARLLILDEEFICQEIHKQHLQCADNAKDLVLALVSQSHNAVSAGIALQDMGLAYKNAGCYYIANPIHLKLALQGFSEWQKLELLLLQGFVNTQPIPTAKTLSYPRQKLV